MPVTYSMTAFARRDIETPWGSLTWELRSVNHRYLELAARLPEELRALEPRLREMVSARLSRGKVDGTLRFQSKESSTGVFELEEDRIRQLIETVDHIRHDAQDVSQLRAIDVLRWPGVLKVPPLDVESLGAAALDLLSAALDDLVATRAREGGRTRQFILQRLETVEQTVAEARAILPETVQLYRERIAVRLKEIKEQLDPSRLEQEIVLFAQKTDVAEELDRLTAHIAEIRRVFNGIGQVGRRLDFLMQELNREANTFSSKSADIRLTNAAVELKVLIEQMREQIQNIE
jgi:uncharacterized protein (TIGR00255 family)